MNIDRTYCNHNKCTVALQPPSLSPLLQWKSGITGGIKSNNAKDVQCRCIGFTVYKMQHLKEYFKMSHFFLIQPEVHVLIILIIEKKKSENEIYDLVII